ncbi:hypothetical protein VIGAN_02321600 [Vigna angularis var. angularis]|uniref:Uncharacterized protein n=1 Tax=Vigna angularis var. angularis TaxID=157739 RepID=A0A0S3RI16_PHAAN|nr:hypothetical protein VIGAN_02321600 [Vigna angularis var. angularis]
MLHLLKYGFRHNYRCAFVHGVESFSFIRLDFRFGRILLNLLLCKSTVLGFRLKSVVLVTTKMKRRCLWSKRWKKVMLQLSMSRILISCIILMIIHSGPLCLRDQL